MLWVLKKKWRKMNPENLPRFLTVPEISEILRCSTKHVYKLIAGGILEASIFARSYRVSEAALLDCIEKRKVHHDRMRTK